MDFPIDIIWQIFEKIEHREDCLALARTCRQYWDIWTKFREKMIVYIEDNIQHRYKYKLKSTEILLHSKNNQRYYYQYTIIFRATPSPCDTALEILRSRDSCDTLNREKNGMGHKHCDVEHEHECTICNYFSLQFIKDRISPILFSPIFPLYARNHIMEIFRSKPALSWTRLFLWSDRSPVVTMLFFGPF